MGNNSIRKWVVRFVIIIALALIGGGIFLFYKEKKPTTTSTSPSATTSNIQIQRDFTFSDKIALASYYAWYYKDAAWAEKTEAEHPLAGSYNPQDDNVIDYQLTMAKDVGLDGFTIAWNGIDNPNDKAMIQMLNKIDNSKEYPNFKIAPEYENINWIWKSDDQRFIDELSYLIEVGKEHPSFLKIDGKPVIFIYNPQTFDLNRTQKILDEVKSKAGDAYLIAHPDNWDVKDDYFKYFQTIMTYADKYIPLSTISAHYQDLVNKGKPLIATLIGGTTTLDKNGVTFDRSNGQYLKARYEIAKNNNANWLYITSWNEWFEFAQIEPSRESKFETAKYLREILANFKNTTFGADTATMTVNRAGDKTTIKNEGPGNLYYVRCGLQDRSLLLSLVMKKDEEKTFDQACPEVSSWLLNNIKIENKK